MSEIGKRFTRLQLNLPSALITNCFLDKELKVVDDELKKIEVEIERLTEKKEKLIQKRDSLKEKKSEEIVKKLESQDWETSGMYC